VKPLDVLALPLSGVQVVEASAGTGKTWNICALVLRALLERRLTLEQVLVVTFTNAAAAELRERIRSRLHQALSLLRPAASGPAPVADTFLVGLLEQARQRSGDDPGRQALRLQVALQDFDAASVFTIHGFCQKVLARNPLASGQVMAGHALADDSELRHEVVADAWRREVLGRPMPPLLVQALLESGDGPRRWELALQQVLARPLAPLKWPAGVADLGDPGDPSDPAGAEAADLSDAVAASLAMQHDLHAELASAWPAWRPEVVARLAAASPSLNHRTHTPQYVADAIAAWDQILAAPLRPGRLDKSANRLARTQIATKKGKAAPEHPFFDRAQQWVDGQVALAGPMATLRLGLLRRMLDTAPARLRALARSRRLSSFDGLLMGLHDALQGEPGESLAMALRDRHPVALIDEFQDTDSLQWAIFRRLFGSDTGANTLLALVGDPKQAIYAFRQAELSTYLAARDSVPAAQRHSLVDNQRSVPALLTALNRLYGAAAQPFMQPGLPYQAVRPGAKPRPALVECDAEGRPVMPAALRCWLLPRDPSGLPPAKRLARVLAAEGVAAEIVRLLAAAAQGRVHIAGRTLAAGDIAVLVRTHRDAALMARTLAACGVASAARARESVFHSAEAETVEHLLAALLAPGDGTLLRRVLASDCMGGDAGTLLALRHDDSLLASWHARLAQWRMVWQRQGPAALLRHWLREAGVVQRLLPRADGERRLTNLNHVAELLQAAAQGAASGPGTAAAGHGASTPQAQWRWLAARRREAELDEQRQLRLASDGNLVQIVTIHQSKGLEYPLVFLPFAWDGSLGKDRARYATEKRTEDGSTVLDFSPDAAQDPAHVQAALLGRNAEAQRLIYVALTRAVARCHIVVGPYRRSATDRATSKESACSPLSWLVAPLADQQPEIGAWIAGKERLEADAQESAWWALADIATADGRPEPAAAASVALERLPAWPDGVPPWLDQAEPEASRLTAADLPAAPVPLAWRLASYSALAMGADAATAAADHDLADGAPSNPVGAMADDLQEAADGAWPDDDILNFPRGAVPGSCLHRVFELADFQRPEQWPTAIDRALLEVPLPASPESRGSARPHAARQLLGMLAQVLDTPIPLPSPPGAAGTATPLRLARVPWTRRLVELEFHLPVRQLHADSLSALLAEHGLRGPQWRFAPLHGGALRGFIDAVIEHAGRYWIVDWKSNHLGMLEADYAAPSLADTMTRQGYHLQAQLYLLALHRHLALRLPGYRREQHLGGALYLFVRGMRPGWSASSGVHLTRPDAGLLDRLGKAFAPETGAATAGATP